MHSWRCRPLGEAARRLAGAGLLLSALRGAAWAQSLTIDSIWVSYGLNGTCTRILAAPPDFQFEGQFWCVGPSVHCTDITNPATCTKDPVGQTPRVDLTYQNGNISNNPRIDFDQGTYAGQCAATGILPGNPLNLPGGSVFTNICNQTLFVCARINYGAFPQTAPIDTFEFEIFKFLGTANPLDPQSTPPLRTFFVDRPGFVVGGATQTIPAPTDCLNRGNLPVGCGICVPWDGSYNFLGQLGKTNGIFGFRATVTANIVGPNGNTQITNTRAFPSGATLDGGTPCTGGLGDQCSVVLQQPITVDVTNVHVVQASATLVGSLTPLPGEPYNIIYRLSKDATTWITITNTADANGLPSGSVVRHLVNGVPRPGEGKQLTGAQGETNGTLQNGDAWNGRADNGDLMPPGVYLANIQAQSVGQFGQDLSAAVTAQISLDPLQITDILTAPLTSQSTSLATLTYLLTEPATVYVNIYPPGVSFCRGLADLNNTNTVPDAPSAANPIQDPNVPKDFQPTLGPCLGAPPSNALNLVTPVKTISEQKNFRTPVVSFWDGRDSAGRPVPDGNYVYVIYAALPSQNGFAYGGLPGGPNPADRRIWTSVAKSGYIAVSRGFVTISQIGPATTIVGSSPSVAGLNPFIFSYSLSREAVVNLGIYDSGGRRLVKTLVSNEVRPGTFLNREIWPDGADDNGLVVSSGIYMAQLTAADPFFRTKVTTTTALFPIDLFRVTDVFATQLLQGATDQLSLTYELSQTMNVSWNIYPPGTQITGGPAAWPPCGVLAPGTCPNTVNPNGQPIPPITSKFGVRPGRLLVSDFWDGRDVNGLFVPDGVYIFTLVAQSTTTPQYFATDRIIGTLSVVRGSNLFRSFTVDPHIPTLFNSSSTITLPPYEVQYVLVRQSSVTVSILDTRNPPNLVRVVINGEVRDGGIPNADFWDGLDSNSNFVRPGFYTVQAVATDLATEQNLTSGSTVQQTITVDELRIFDVAVSPLQKEVGPAEIDYQVSEPMKVSVKIYRPGTKFDVAGNPTPTEAVSLVRRIVGVRPALTEIKEVWDGRDQKLALVPDGNYVFRIVGSTDTASVDTITGNVVQGASLADDLVVANVGVLRGESADPAGDFQSNTFMYPNPVSGAQATFNIFVSFQSNVDMKIFNIAGELVYEQNFLNQPPTLNNPNGPIVFQWPRVNNAGRKLASGVYYVVFREEETLGGANVLQSVKRMLLQ